VIKSLKLVDLAVSVLFLAYGIYLVWTQYPEPTWTAILLVVGGAIGIPASFFDIASRARKLTFRSMVKKRV
jgi:hypothetical protein